MKKAIALLLLLHFAVVISAPVMLSFYSQQMRSGHKAVLSHRCNGNEDNGASMYNNGNQYLKALIKRACETNRKDKSLTVNLSISGFVWFSPLARMEEEITFSTKSQTNFRYINLYSGLQSPEIFHPPAV